MPIPPTIRTFTAWHAAALYLAATVWWTWPLFPNITHAIAWDLGDPMLVAWVMGWVNDSVLALLRGDIPRYLALWDAPIFHPQPLALAYSEHFIPQALAVLPLHAATGNVVLCYNAALVLTFVLSGTGMFLLTRELTSNTPAAFLAGAMYAFTPYRIDQLSHLQTLSSQWLPFVVYGLRRYFTTLSVRPLVWAVLALVASNLSSGYYLFFFSPFVALYVAYEILSRRLWRHRRVWTHLGAAGAATLALTIPFLLPYLSARAETGPRSYEAVREFSADVYGYFTASGYIEWLGETLDAMREYPENALFPGFVATALACVLALRLASDARRRWFTPSARERYRLVTAVLLACAALAAGVAVWIAWTGGRITQVAGVEVRIRNLGRLLLYGTAALAGAAALSPRVRGALRGAPGSLAGPALIFAFLAALLSLGPRMESMHEPIGFGPYIWYMFVPGVNGLRVPARFAMIVMFWLAIAGAYAAGVFGKTRWGRAIVLAATIAAIAESRTTRFGLNVPFAEENVAPLTMAHRMRFAEPLYEKLRELPRGVLLELPWGTTGWDLQYMHAQRRHGWPLVNGFSGDFPPSHLRTDMVELVFTEPERAWWALERAGASHVIVHEWAFFSPDRGKRVSAWLRDNGAVEVARTDNDALFRLPGGIKHR